MYEHRSAPLLSRGQFAMRLAKHVGAIGALVAISLLVGMVGYHVLGRMTWTDAFLNSAMLLGGMGPVGDLPNDTAKIFAGVYALYAGLVFIVSSGIIIAPIAHRILHRLHVEGGKKK
jgi:hypothetical protein